MVIKFSKEKFDYNSSLYILVKAQPFFKSFLFMILQRFLEIMSNFVIIEVSYQTDSRAVERGYAVRLRIAGVACP